MASYSQDFGWASLLIEAAENVRNIVRRALLNKPALALIEIKELLDRKAQAAVEETLRQSGMPARIISEEGECVIGEGGPYVVVDPVDGTTNLARGIPLAVTSLAVSETPRLAGVFTGIVLDLYSGELFRAERNRGAWRGGVRIHPSRSRPIDEALISIDISKGAPIEPVKELISRAKHLRELGCSALSLCYMASGVMDAHVDLRGSLRATDVAAGLLILKEAGGIYSINRVVSGDLELNRESTLTLVAASSPWMLDEINRLTI